MEKLPGFSPAFDYNVAFWGWGEVGEGKNEATYFEEFSEVGKSSNLDVINVFGAVFLEDREEICAGVGGA